jgi:hypothetical protein
MHRRPLIQAVARKERIVLEIARFDLESEWSDSNLFELAQAQIGVMFDRLKLVREFLNRRRQKLVRDRLKTQRRGRISRRCGYQP